MQVQFSDEGERLVARPLGRLEASEGADFAAAVEERVQAGARSVTIDLGSLESINFGGLRALLRLARSLKGRDTGIAFAPVGGEVGEMVDMSGLDSLFPSTPLDPSSGGIQNASSTP
jgi:anti-sigma B factor antagonist